MLLLIPTVRDCKLKPGSIAVFSYLEARRIE